MPPAHGFARALRSTALLLFFFLSFGAVCPSAAAETIILPPPLDKLLDAIIGYPPNLQPGEALDAPRPFQVQKPMTLTPQNIMPLFLGIPYRPDGGINDNGEYALFNAPNTRIAAPGLNCSGLVLAASRIILDRNIPVASAVRDREGDSGPDSPDGHDWDFGFDLIMNISEGVPRAILAPGRLASMARATGKTVPSFDLHSPAFQNELLPHIRKNGFYLVSFSKHREPHSPAYLHYHTGIIVRDGDNVWLYSTTAKSGKVIRYNLAAADDLARFRVSFRNTPRSCKRLTVIAVRVEL